MMTYDEMIAVLVAAKAGASIYVKPHGSLAWENTLPPQWNFGCCDYSAEPPQKVKMWRWVIKAWPTYPITESDFSTDEDRVYLRHGKQCQIIQRADWTMIEVDAEIAK